MQKLELGNITVELVKKNIKNIHLSVYPPTGRVKISAPLRMEDENIRMYVISKLSWIKQQQLKMRKQEREEEKSYSSRESHYYLGNRYLLKIVSANTTPTVYIEHDKMVLVVKEGMDAEQRQKILQEWYRKQLRTVAEKYIGIWEKRMNVKVEEFGIRKMKTKWGTCNPTAKRIWLNLELARKPIEHIEYIIVHEMTHLHERTHNKKFIAHMNKYIPMWRNVREELNRLPLGYTDWSR